MKPEIQLIQLYLWACTTYDKHPTLKYQRWSNNPTPPRFTDQELLTVYLFGVLKGHFKQKAIHSYVQEHWGVWFPHLPSYKACNHRLNLLHEVWPVLLGQLWSTLGCPSAATGGADQLLDSLPIMLAVRGRSCAAKVALDQADQSYGESKQLWYHGVKLQLLGAKQYHQLPVPLRLCLTPASRHDLPVLKEQVLLPLPGALFGDKAYRDQTTKWSRFVSAMRQPIESFFNWLYWTKPPFRTQPKCVPVKACWCIAMAN